VTAKHTGAKAADPAVTPGEARGLMAAGFLSAEIWANPTLATPER
jgi:hypothetical protein